jgi:hypothetical protein
MTESPITPTQSTAAGSILAKGLVDNLPAIIDGFKSIYALRAKEDAFRQAL